MDLPQGSSMLRAAWLSMHGFNVRAVSTVSTGRQLPLASAANDDPPSLFHAPCSGAFLDVRGIPFNFPLDIHHALAAHVCTVMLRVFFWCTWVCRRYRFSMNNSIQEGPRAGESLRVFLRTSKNRYVSY